MGLFRILLLSCWVKTLEELHNSLFTFFDSRRKDIRRHKDNRDERKEQHQMNNHEIKRINWRERDIDQFR